jgi:putative cardiolipin synthase
VTALLILSALLQGCASLPKHEGRVASAVLTDTGDTRLGKVIEATAAEHPGESGVYPLGIPKEAFAARVVLARRAESSLDVQYYIWHADTTGWLMFEEVWNAAERGVRVRMLLDDNGIAGLDPTLAALDGHPRIEVRLFNPYPNRGVKVLGYLTDFKRLNHRMHNKSFTADAQATIVGGRNIGDEYFEAGSETVFTDLDVVAVGPIAGEVGTAFDLFWNSESAYPAESILPPAKPDALAEMKAKFAAVQASAEAVEYIDAVKATTLVEKLMARELRMEWSRVQLVCDEPAKTLGKAEEADLMLTRLKQVIGQPEREMDIVSPYFVPREGGTKSLCGYVERGIRLRVFTNSLAATDVGSVHAGYSKSRKDLLRCGVILYELKPDAESAEAHRTGSAGGGASASLHAKTISVDRSRVFVGSFNLDPRSVSLNTEMGLVIDSPELAAKVSTRLDEALGRVAYHVVLTENGSLEWVEQTEKGEVRFNHEPQTTFFKRLTVSIFKLLPIDWML